MESAWPPILLTLHLRAVHSFPPNMKSLVLFLVPATSFAASIHIPRVAAPASSALTPATSLPGGWTYSGCSVDGLNPRSLSLAAYQSSTAMTGETCIAFCSAKGYNVAGTEYSGECFCGTALPTLAQESDCNMACSGNSAEACGGPARLSVYSNPVQGAPGVNPGVSGWLSQGCVADSVSARTLPSLTQVSGPMTVAKCIAACQADSYTLAGVEVKLSYPLPYPPARPTALTLHLLSTRKNAGAATAPP